MKQAAMVLANNTARQTSLLETIDKTQVMCTQFNRAAEDLRNQIDTTDIYIENYLPFRTMKEIGTLLTSCFDDKISAKIRIFEAKRIQQLYARMVKTAHKAPDFKTRLTRMRKEKAANIPGFSKIDRSGQKNENLNLPIKDLDKWFNENEMKLKTTSDLKPGQMVVLEPTRAEEQKVSGP